MQNFRLAEMPDVEEIVALVNSAYRGDSSRTGWTTEADLLGGQRTDESEIRNLINADDSIILLFFDDGKMIGTVHLQHEMRVAFLGMLVIKPGKQGAGLGKKLMQAAEATAIKMWHVEKMQMYVITLRYELIAYYERRGYRRTVTLKAFPQEIRFGIPKIADLQLVLLEKTLV